MMINVKEVVEVLLYDGWISVSDESFYIEDYEFVSGEGLETFSLHQPGDADICPRGFTFKSYDPHKVISGPLSSVLAVKTLSKD